MATISDPRPVVVGRRDNCDSSSSRVNFRRFLKAFRAAFSCSFAGGVGGGTSSVMVTSAKGKGGRRVVGQTISRPPGASCVVGPFRKVNPSAPKLPVPARDVQRFAGDP